MNNVTFEQDLAASQSTIEVLKKRIRKLESLDECSVFLQGMLNSSRKDEEIQRQLKDLVMEHATCCIAVVSDDGKNLLVNKKAYELLGYHEHELLSMASKDVFGDYHCNNIEQMLCRKDGSWILVGMTIAIGDWGDSTVHIIVFNDITEKKRLEEEMKALSSFPEENPQPVWRLTYDDQVIYANPAAKTITEHITKQGLWQQSLHHTMDQKEDIDVEIEAEKRWFKCLFVYTSHGYINVYATDISNRIKATMALHKAYASMEGTVVQRTRELTRLNDKLHLEIKEHQRTKTMFAQELHRTLFDSCSDSIVLLNQQGAFSCNQATLKIFACRSVKDFISRPASAFSPKFQPCGTLSKQLAAKNLGDAFKHGSHHFEWLHQKLDGRTFNAEVHLTAYKHDGKSALQATVRDISQRKQLENDVWQAKSTLEQKVIERTEELSTSNQHLQKEIIARQETEEKLRTLSYQDELTGLGNRRRMFDRINHAIDLGKRNHGSFALLFLDLDHFKVVNDTLGHQAGDDLLKQVAYRLQSSVRTSDTVVRMGGDEFAILLENTQAENEVFKVADSIINNFNDSFFLNEAKHHMHCSLGIALFPNHAETAIDLFKCADIALYKAKEVRNNYSTYNSVADSMTNYLNQLNHDLHDAIEDNQLYLLYQPKVSLSDGEIIGAEALIRWKHPKHGIISPMEFIPIAEGNGLMVPIGDWIMDEACKTLQKWKSLGFKNLCMAVNLSPIQFVDQSLFDKVEQSMNKYDITTKELEVEITETLTMEDPEKSVTNIQKFVDMGISIAIDDFGTGYSSLSRLKDMPINTLKIDRSFIGDICHDHNDRVFVEMIINMSKLLNLTIVAEGIEEQEHVLFLQALDCDIGQGYLFSPPICSDDFIKLLQQAPFQFQKDTSNCDHCDVEYCPASEKEQKHPTTSE